MDAKGRTLPDPDTLPGPEHEPVIAWATVIKKQTDDGMIEVDPKMVGARIPVDLRSTTVGTLFNREKKLYHRRMIIYTVPRENNEWVATELLDIDL